MELQTGNTLKGYRLMDRIGEGGFGVVYRAYQPVIEREVVVKAILPIYANDPNFIRNFEAEAQLIARLEHLHIVPLYDYWRDPSGAYLVMRLLKGGSLLEVLRAGALDIDTATRMLEQIASALEVAHKNNIVHQDIKPANILFDDQQNAYLSDFGIAKDLASAVNLAKTDNENTVHGSPAYVAPEQITRGDVGARADIYSLGLLMFEALVGEHPFPGSSLMELLKHQLNTPLPPLQIHRPKLPDELSTVLWRATSKSPEGRYKNATDMAEDFRQIVNTMRPAEKTQPITLNNPTDPKLRKVTAVINLATGTLNPYKGLRPFDEADSADFFGRDQLISTIIERISPNGSDNRFLAVVGPSGSGKSSAVKAGVIPRIRKSKSTPWNKTFIVNFTPGSDPITNLESALLSIATNTQSLELDRLQNDTKSLNPIISQILPDETNQILLAIDQFEEVFTQIPDEAKRKHFLDLISNALKDQHSRMRVIVTLRADFYDRPLMYAGIGDLIKKNTEVVLPLSTEELKEAVVGPASKASLVFEPGLVEIILDDVEKQPNALPLLQYTLTELYERRDNLKLTIKGYQASGGITGSLARRADQLYTKMIPAQRQATRELFLRLVTLGDGTEDTRRRALRSELNATTITKDTMQEVLNQFSQYRLLTFDHDPESRAPTVEIAHEALIRRWDHLQRWLTENREDLRLQRKLAIATNDWLRANREADYLAQGARLTQFEPLLENTAITLSQDEHDYVEVSVRKRQNARRRVQGFVAMLIVISLIAVVSAIVAINQRNATQQARNLAVQERDRADEESIISRSRELAASALVQVEQIDLPLLLSLEALNIADTFEARNSLLTTLQQQPRLITFLSAHTDNVRAVAYSPDGTIIATGGRDNTVILWDAITYQPLGQPLHTHTDWVNTLAFSPDGTLLASASRNGEIILWDVTNQQQITTSLAGHEDEIYTVTFVNNTTLASGSADNLIHIWDVESGDLINTLTGHTDIVYALASNTDGTILASGGADNRILLWDISDIESEEMPFEELLGHTNWVFALDFHPNDQILVSGSADNTIIFWDVNEATPLTQALQAHQNWVRDVNFTPDGQSLITGGADGLVLVWDVRTASVLNGFITIGNNAIRDIALSPTDNHILTAGDMTSALIWSSEAQSNFEQTLYTHDEQILTTDISPDGNLLATAGGLQNEFVINIWDTVSNEMTYTLQGHDNTVTSIAFSHDNHYLASASTDQTIIIWDMSTGEQVHTIEASDSIFSLAFSPINSVLAYGDNDGNISIWDFSGSVENWDRLFSTNAHDDRVTSLTFSPDGTVIASGSRDNAIRLWDTQTGTALSEPLIGHTDGVLSVAFNPTGELLASSSRDSTILLWNVTTQTQIAELSTTRIDWVMDVAFSPDGTMLASGDGSKAVVLWDVATRRILGSPFIEHTDWVNSLAFSPDGEFLISVGRDGQVLQWSTSLAQWQSIACNIVNRNFNAEERDRYLQGNTATFDCS